MIKTGILGTSESAALYAGILKNSEIFELTGCFSPDYSKSKTFASQFGLVAYPSAEAIFNYADTLIITDFSPDFLLTTEKAIKNFKHILITNPFLAGLEEIQHLRKLSEESGVIMHIAGGFKFNHLFTKTGSTNIFYADLKHTFPACFNICQSSGFMEHLLNDISLLLFLLKGMSKKTSISAWEICSSECVVIPVRIELDNGNIANILISQMEDKEDVNLHLYGADGLRSFNLQERLDKTSSVEGELIHFENNITNRHTNSSHNDIMFQALELTHRIKMKTFQNFAVNYQH
jgi:hypothetical protein